MFKSKPITINEILGFAESERFPLRRSFVTCGIIGWKPCIFSLFIFFSTLYLVVVVVVVQSLSRVQLLQPYALQPARLLCPWNSPGKNTGVGCHLLLQILYLGAPKCIENFVLLNCSMSESLLKKYICYLTETSHPRQKQNFEDTKFCEFTAQNTACSQQKNFPTLSQKNLAGLFIYFFKLSIYRLLRS